MREKGTEDQLSADDVGIVAIGRNEGERLIRCLHSIGCDSREIVYVDSGSSDDSVTTAERLGAHIVNLDLSRPFTAARARNEGFAALLALKPNLCFVQFIDGDCILVHGWLSIARRFIEQRSDVAIVCGRRREIHPTESIYNELCDIEWDTPVGEAIGCGGDALVRIAAFKAVGGFRTELIAGEEPELCVRLREQGWRIWRIDAEMTKHDAAMRSIAQYWTRAVRGGHAYAEVSRLHKSSKYGIWKREFASAIFWGGLLPLITIFVGLLHPIAFALVLAYPLQIARIGFARGPELRRSWKYAFLLTVAKFAEFQGILKCYWGRFIHRNVALIEYK